MKYIKLLVIVFIFMILVAGCAIGDLSLSSYEYQPKIKSEVYSTDGQLIGEIYNENRSYVKLDQIPQDLKDAIIAVEDSRFYDHFGFDILRTGKAVIVNIRSREREQGGSTITQQLAKNLFLTNEKTYTRKIKELVYSLQLERKYTKDQILEMYLNEIFLGQQSFGVQEASKRYFGKDVGELSLGESALIAGLPQAPSAYDPTRHFERAKNRQEVVLNRMVANKNITQEQADEAKKEEITIIENNDADFAGRYMEGTGHFNNRVINELVGFLAKNMENRNDLTQEEIYQQARHQLENGGYKIHTTLNMEMQNKAMAAINNGISNLGEAANGTLVSIEPDTGRLLSYYGGVRDIDMANKPRQPGSTIKPLYYAGAINEGLMNSNTILLDEPTKFGQDGYTPQNFGGTYRGYVTMREAMVNSINTVSVKIMDYMGINKAMNYIEDFGIDTLEEEDFNLATALGGMTRGISPIEMANSYGTFANNGVYKEVYFIEKVEDQRGNIIYSRDNQQLEVKQTLSKPTSHEISEMLTDVINRGTGKSARLPYYTAGKTGTSNENRDLWFIGFAQPLVTSVWIGNEDNMSISGSSSIPANIYKNYMNNIINDGLIETSQLRPVTVYDDTMNISILLSDNGINQTTEITEEDVADIIIPRSEYNYFEARIVERIDIDGGSGKRFVEGHCPEENKETKIFREGQGPQEDCNYNHMFDRFQHFYDNLWNREDDILQEEPQEPREQEENRRRNNWPFLNNERRNNGNNNRNNNAA